MKAIFAHSLIFLALLHFGCGGDNPIQSENELDFTSIELAALLSSQAGQQFAQAPWDVNNDGNMDASDLLLVVEHLDEDVEIPDAGGAVLHVINSQVGSRTIQVTGLGSAFGEPDKVALVLGVSVERRSVQEARDTAAEAMNGVLDSLKANGVADIDFQTQQFTIHQQFDYVDAQRLFRGYNVTNTVSAILREIELIGQSIDDAAESGGDLVQVQSIQFGIEDSEGLKENARVAAMQNALAKAQTLATEGGVRLGKPISISEGGSSILSQVFVKGFDAAEAVAETPIEAGQLRVTVSVNVIYEIE